jgi:hypothetical protein
LRIGAAEEKDSDRTFADAKILLVEGQNLFNLMMKILSVKEVYLDSLLLMVRKISIFMILFLISLGISTQPATQGQQPDSSKICS